MVRLAHYVGDNEQEFVVIITDGGDTRDFEGGGFRCVDVVTIEVVEFKLTSFPTDRPLIPE